MNGWVITGGCGFVGTNLADALLTKGEDVIILDNLSKEGSIENLHWLRQRHGEMWRFVKADVRDADGLSRLDGMFLGRNCLPGHKD